MKHSMFLFLLLFTLSTSVEFDIIKEPGLYLWNISEHNNENPKYVRIDVSSSSNVGISKSCYRHFDIPEGSRSKEKRSTSILNTFNTYIILKIDASYKYFLFYWVGAQSSEKKRINVAHSVGFLLKKILMERPKLHLKVFHREAEGVESTLLSKILQLHKSKDKLKLYRVAGSRGQFIMEVPQIYSELNGSDSFVLDKYREMYVWNSLHSNEHKKRQAESLINRILDFNQNRSRSENNFFWVTEGDLKVDEHVYETFVQKFLKGMKNVPIPRVFPQIQINYTDTELENKRREELKLYSYYWSFPSVIETPIPWTVLNLNTFRENNTYVLADFKCGNIIVFLGNNADVEQFTNALSAAEKLSKIIDVKDAWQRVRIIRQGQKLPIWFEIYFSNEW